MFQNGPPTCSWKKNSGGQREEAVHHVLWECLSRKDQMQVSHLNKNMLEHCNSSALFHSHTLGLALSTPGLVKLINKMLPIENLS